MAYRIVERLPSGGPKTYEDTDTGARLSARQYRNRTEAARSGFRTISQKQRATSKKHRERVVSRLGFVSYYHDLGVPRNLGAAILSIIKLYDARHGIAIVVGYIVTGEDEEPQILHVQTQVWRAIPESVKPLLEEITVLLEQYQIERAINLTAAVYPPRGQNDNTSRTQKY